MFRKNKRRKPHKGKKRGYVYSDNLPNSTCGSSKLFESFECTELLSLDQLPDDIEISEFDQAVNGCPKLGDWVCSTRTKCWLIAAEYMELEPRESDPNQFLDGDKLASMYKDEL